MATEAIFLGTRVFIGGVLVIAVIGKVRDFRSFVSAVRSFRVISRRWERPLALLVVLAELMAALLLTVRDLAAIGLSLAVLLLAAFTAAMVRVLARGDRVACGCFGSSTVLIGKMHVLRNGVITMVGVGGIVASVTSDGTPLDAAWVGVVSAFAILSAALFVLLDQVLAIPLPAAVPADRSAHVRNSTGALTTRSTTRTPSTTTATGRQ